MSWDGMFMYEAPRKVESPCRKVCEVEDGVCVGCGRTMAEIASWTRMTPEQRRAIMQRLENEGLSAGRE